MRNEAKDEDDFLVIGVTEPVYLHCTLNETALVDVELCRACPKPRSNSL
jgi:hypothetical protein